MGMAINHILLRDGAGKADDFLPACGAAFVADDFDLLLGDLPPMLLMLPLLLLFFFLSFWEEGAFLLFRFLVICEAST